MRSNTATADYDREKLQELRSLEASLLAHAGPGPTRRIPSRPGHPRPEQPGDETGEPSSNPPTPADTGPIVAEVAADLLRGITNAGPAVIAIARQAAEATRWVWCYSNTIGQLFDHGARGGSDAAGTMREIERIARLRAMEVQILGRFMLTLGMLRDHELLCEARVVERAERVRTAHRRR